MNSFGRVFRITTWGESHSPALGVIIEGCPAGLELEAEEITAYLQAHDRPIEELATERVEPNRVELLSGVYEGRTIGTPISLLIRNEDYRQKDYRELNKVFRPGHGDYSYHKKYGTPNISGGGRASGRECITRLAAGYVAEKLISYHYKEFSIGCKLTELAGIKTAGAWTKELAIEEALRIADEGDSSGGIVEVELKGLPAGLGEPLFDSLDARLAAACLSIGGVKSFEMGIGREAAAKKGSMLHDDFSSCEGALGFSTNNCGGVLSGISSGQPLIIRLAVKPTPSIRLSKVGATAEGELAEVRVKGRHDKNFAPRVAPIAGAMAAITIADYLILAGRINKDRIKEESHEVQNRGITVI